MGDEVQSTSGASSGAKRREEKARKKDQRSWENVCRSMGDVTDSEKINFIQERYTCLYNELRQVSVGYQALEKQFVQMQRERDQLRAELNKNILAKAKLESLCRELQKQNKAIKVSDLIIFE